VRFVPKVTFVQPGGDRLTVEVESGSTGMDAARSVAVRGLRGECGGEGQCSTCHCYVDEGWLPHLPPRNAIEANLIDFVWRPTTASRLSCQLVITDALDGLVLHVPAYQIGGP
jgi:2Fe-2S ferredoxin